MGNLIPLVAFVQTVVENIHVQINRLINSILLEEFLI